MKDLTPSEIKDQYTALYKQVQESQQKGTDDATAVAQAFSSATQNKLRKFLFKPDGGVPPGLIKRFGPGAVVQIWEARAGTFGNEEPIFLGVVDTAKSTVDFSKQSKFDGPYVYFAQTEFGMTEMADEKTFIRWVTKEMKNPEYFGESTELEEGVLIHSSQIKDWTEDILKAKPGQKISIKGGEWYIKLDPWQGKDGGWEASDGTNLENKDLINKLEAGDELLQFESTQLKEEEAAKLQDKSPRLTTDQGSLNKDDLTEVEVTDYLDRIDPKYKNPKKDKIIKIALGKLFGSQKEQDFGFPTKKD